MFKQAIARLEQVILEDMYGKHNNYQRILDDIKQGLDLPIAKACSLIEEYFEGEYWESKNLRIAAIKHLEPVEIVHKILAQVIPNDHNISYQQVVSPLANWLNYVSIFDGVKTAAELVAVVCFSDLYNIIPASDSESGSLMIRSNCSLIKETRLKLDKTRYLPPLVVKPNPITDNYSSGYLTKKESVILGKGNHHNEPIALDVLNMLNGIKLSLDERSLQYTEESKKPLDTQEKRINHQRMVETSIDVYNDMLDKGNEFYLTWKYDKRGRVYSAGYHINIQSTDYKKSLLNLANKEIIEGI